MTKLDGVQQGGMSQQTPMQFELAGSVSCAGRQQPFRCNELSAILWPRPVSDRQIIWKDTCVAGTRPVCLHSPGWELEWATGVSENWLWPKRFSNHAHAILVEIKDLTHRLRHRQQQQSFGRQVDMAPVTLYEKCEHLRRSGAAGIHSRLDIIPLACSNGLGGLWRLKCAF